MFSILTAGVIAGFYVTCGWLAFVIESNYQAVIFPWKKPYDRQLSSLFTAVFGPIGLIAVVVTMVIEQTTRSR
jgi:hypothetical protein